ncbi:hypothetical protein [Streptomyces clavifer]|uniref:hypothetical protein n=1 Tax=Streptomyces clavifer TaxID=68188 RepID=UPI00380D2ABC
MADDLPVRVGRFEWERLMIMSDLPEPDRFKLLAVAIFMSADGSSVRPGNNGLAEFGPHADTWKKLLQRTVKAGWLIQVERGGARRGPNGTTIRRASVYAASAPKAAWDRRADVVNSPPFRSAALEGGGKSTPGPLKGAPNAPLKDGESLKGAPGTPFKGSPSVSKGAPRDPLQESGGETPEVLKGVQEVSKGASESFEGGTATPPHHVVPSRSSSSRTTTTSVVDLDSDPWVVETHTDGGGGDVQGSIERATAFVDLLDFWGKKEAQRRKEIALLVAGALKAGWAEQDLKRYLDISGQTDIRSPAHVYLYRLAADQLPDPDSDPRRGSRGRHQPYRNPADQSEYHEGWK